MNPTLEKWREVCEAATEGPWEFERIAHDNGEFAYERNDDHALMVLRETNYEKPMKAKFDAEFIALSRTAWPVAIECLEMALEGLKYYQFGHNHLGHNHPDTLEPHCKSCGVIKQIHARLEQVK